jgi:hypothetical protein
VQLLNLSFTDSEIIGDKLLVTCGETGHDWSVFKESWLDRKTAEM